MTKTSDNTKIRHRSIAELTSNLGRQMRWHIALSSLILSLAITSFLVIFHVNERLSYMFKGLESHYAQLLSGGDVYEVTRSLKSLQKSEAFSAAWIVDDASKNVLASVIGGEPALESYTKAKSLTEDRNFVFIELRPYFNKLIKIHSHATKKVYLVECIAPIPLAPAVYSVLIALVMFLVVGEYFKSIFANLTDKLTKPLTRFVAVLRHASSFEDRITDSLSRPDSYMEIIELSVQLEAFQQRAVNAESFAKKAERLAAIGETTSAIAHDIKEPLHSIKKIASSPLSEPRQKAMMASIKEIDLLVQDLLEYSRPQTSGATVEGFTSVNRELKGLIDSINQIQAIGKEKANVSIQFLSSLENDEVTTSMPPLHFRRVVKNIIDNALAALADRDDKSIQPILKVEVKVDERDTEIIVANNGPRLKPDELLSIFEPFKSNRIGKGGTGLGLAIVKKLVNDFSGKVFAANRSGFVVFSIKLPIYMGASDVH